MSAPPATRKATQPSGWPRCLTTVNVTAFQTMGWTAEGWHDVDCEPGLLTDPSHQLQSPPPISRDYFSLREWVRNPPDFDAPITPGLFASTVAAHGRGRAPMALDALAAGASPRFVAAFLADFMAEFRFKTARPDLAWAATSAAGLVEVDATGWALTGHLLARPARSRVTDIRTCINNQLLPWVNQLGPTSWLYVLAGFTLDEAVALRTAGQSPTGQQLRVMAALNGHTLPADI